MARTFPRAALVCAFLASGEAHAGVTLKVVNAGRKVTLELQGKKIRVQEEGNPRVLAFDGDAGRYYEIDESARTWAVATQEDVVAAGRAADARIRERLSTADPEEVRAWIERRNRVRRRLDATKRTRFELGGGQAMILDQMCDGFDEVVAGEVVSWGCYATWGGKSFRKDEFIAVTRLAEFLNSGLAHVEAAQGIDLRDGPLGRLARAPGLPLVRIDLKEGGRSAVPMKVIEIVRGTIPPERFAPPAGYARSQQPPSLLGSVKAALPAEPPPEKPPSTQR